MNILLDIFFSSILNTDSFLQPMLREVIEKNPHLNQEQAVNELKNCLRVLFYRDARSLNKVSSFKNDYVASYQSVLPTYERSKKLLSSITLREYGA